MLPHVQHEKGNRGGRNVSLLVVELLNDEVVADGVPGKECPSRTLESESGSVEVSPELLERSEEFVDGRGQFSRGAVLRIRGQVLPKNAVVCVATEVEGEVLLEAVDVGEIVCLPCFGQLFKSSVRTGT